MRPKYNLDNVNPEDFDLGCSPNGWISADCFFGWLANLFYPSIKDKVQFPIVVLMDGHTSHINIAVAEFCKEKDIILYCLPPHASHILQPLDVAVFGPMKKIWNKCLDDFKRDYKGLSMTRNHFFPVFDKCWKEATGAQNVKAGFKKCGLVPLNRDTIDYSKIIETIENRPITLKTEKLASDQERIGMLRMHQIVLNCFPNSLMQTMEKRRDEGYNISDDTALGTLWKIYQSTNKAISDASKPPIDSDITLEPSTSNMPASVVNATADVGATQITRTISATEFTANSQSITISSNSAVDMNTSTTSNFDNSAADTPFVTSSVNSASDTCAITIFANSAEDTETAISAESVANTTSRPSCSNVTFPSYESLKFSPFKSHLGIGDNVIISRKVTTAQTKIPFAISGDEYVGYLKGKQDKKKRELDEKEKRRIERETKRKKKSVKSNTETNSGESQVIIFDDNSDDELPEIQTTNSCQACLGDDGWSDDELWIGCSSAFKNRKCDKWFHKNCLSDNVAQMGEEELKAYELLCDICSAIKKSQKNKKK